MSTNNLHPHARYFALSHIRQVRMMVRTGHPMYHDEGLRLIKDGQRELVRIRALRREGAA